MKTKGTEDTELSQGRSKPDRVDYSSSGGGGSNSSSSSTYYMRRVDM